MISSLQTTIFGERPTDLCTDGTLMAFGLCPAQPLRGHLNWSVATYIGSLMYESYSGNWPQDHDYNFWINAGDNAGMTTTEDGMGLEFDGEETVDYFSNPWWKQVLGSRNDETIGSAINWHTAVAIGLVGIDGAHWDGHAESHPVFAMAIQLSVNEKDDAIDEQWVYFLRNVGGEGSCSHMGHYWPTDAGVYYLPFPWPSSDVTDVKVSDSQFWKDDGTNVSVTHGTYPEWSYLKFQFPNVEAGDISTHYRRAPLCGKF